jgi:hypothetical protein
MAVIVSVAASSIHVLFYILELPCTVISFAISVVAFSAMII